MEQQDKRDKSLRILLVALGIIFWTYSGLRFGSEESESVRLGAEVPREAASLPKGFLADQFVIYYPSMIVVRTTQGELFARDLDPATTSGWEELEEETLSKGEGRSPCRMGEDLLEDQYMPDPSGRITSMFDCEYYPHAEAYDLTSYILLEDGSVWRWWPVSRGMGSGFADLFRRISNTVIYGGGGFFIGGFSYWLFNTIARIIRLVQEGGPDLDKFRNSSLNTLKVLTIFVLGIGF